MNIPENKQQVVMVMKGCLVDEMIYRLLLHAPKYICLGLEIQLGHKDILDIQVYSPCNKFSVTVKEFF